MKPYVALCAHLMCLAQYVLDPQQPRVYVGADFGSLVEKGSVFLDKSLFIKEIVTSAHAVTLITMPRRWGNQLV